MSEPVLRVVLLAGVVVVVALGGWLGSRRRPARPRETTRSDLSPGVHLFSSATCSSCVPARAALTSVVGREFGEVRYEDDPIGFARFSIAKVPTVIVVGKSGEAVIFEGVPRKRDLRRVVSGRW